MRVSVIRGTTPIILVCPHGANDPTLTVIVEECARHAGANAVINRGFQVADDVDVCRDRADCDRIDHIKEDVVRDEFLDPLLSLHRTLARRYPRVLVFFLNALDRRDESAAGKPLDLVLGFGQAVVNNAHTCPMWIVDMFIHEWVGLGWAPSGIYCGKPGGRHSARSIHHLPQLFRKYHHDPGVYALSLWISWRFLLDRTSAAFCGTILSDVIGSVAAADFFGEPVVWSYV